MEIKTTAKPSLGIHDLFQMIAYSLLDLDNEYELDTIAFFSTRYAYYAEWPLEPLLLDLAGYSMSLPQLRDQFRQTLAAHQ